MMGGITSSLHQSQALNQLQQMRTAFQQLGTDLQSGNVAAAQNDFESMTASHSKSTESQEIKQLSQDLQSGNLFAAQQDYTALQRTMQQHAHGYHSRGGPGAAPTSPKTGDSSGTDPLSLLTNLATTAASAYGSAGITGALTAGSMLSALI